MSDYDSRADVYFHESRGHPFYFVSFDPEYPGLLDAIVERIEGQFGEDYERAVEPGGDGVYVGYIKYDSDVEDPEEGDDWYTLNQVPPEYLDTDLDGETYEEETTECAHNNIEWWGRPNWVSDQRVDFGGTCEDCDVDVGGVFTLDRVDEDV